MSLIPLELQEKLNILKSKLQNITKRAYIVGGAVRDMQMGITPKDLDIEVFGITHEQFETLACEIGAVGIGKSFFVYKWGEIDISLPRREKKVGVGHTAFEVAISDDEKEASSRRDFRMNALMLNIFSGELLDFWGGVADIKNKKISIINKDSFIEDSLRILRAMQFAARFGFRIPRDECAFMRGIKICDLSHNRIVWEFEKMFDGTYPHYGLYYFFALGIASKLFGLHISRVEFSKIALELAKNKNSHEPHNKRFIFFYTLWSLLHLKDGFFVDKIELPTIYAKRLKEQKRVPKNRTDRFLVALSLKYPIRDWLGSYKNEIKQRAKKLGIYDSGYHGEIFARDVAKEGYSGKDIATETRKRLLNSIRANFK